MGNDDSKSWLFTKIISVWGMVGITSWSEAASFAAFCLTCYLLFRHIWRDFFRAILERFGLIKPSTPAETLADAIEDVKDDRNGI